MSFKTLTFDLTPELLSDIMFLMKRIQQDNFLLQSTSNKKKNIKEEKNPTMEIFHEVFNKLGLTGDIVSKVLEETFSDALEIKSLTERLHTPE